MSVFELFDIKELPFSVRAIHVCESLSLNNYNLLIEYFKRKKNFYQARNSGEKTNIELLLFCKLSLNYKLSEINISELFKQSSHLNFLYKNNFHSIYELLEYYNWKKNFYKLTNCSIRLNSYLINICEITIKFIIFIEKHIATVNEEIYRSTDEISKRIKKYENLSNLTNDLTSSIEEQYSTLTSKYKNIIQSYLKYLWVGLSPRAKRIISELYKNAYKITKYDITEITLIEFLKLSNIDHEIIKNYKNFGYQTYIQIRNIRENLISILQYIDKNKDEISNVDILKKVEQQKHLLPKKCEITKFDIIEDDNNRNNFKSENLENIIFNLTPTQKKLVRNYIEVYHKSLSYATQKRININQDLDKSSKVLTEEISRLTDFKGRNVSKRIQLEIKEFKYNIYAFCTNLYNNGEDYFYNIETSKLILKTLFKVKGGFIDEVYNNKMEDFKLFKTINHLLEEGYLYDGRSLTIFKCCFGFYNDSCKLTLEEVGDIYNITRERVRQLKGKVEKEFENKLKFCYMMKEVLIKSYEIKVDESLIYFDESKYHKILNNEGVVFSKLFLEKIFSIILKDSHKTLATFDYKSENKYYIPKEIYFISNKIYKAFAIKEFLNDINKRINKNISESYSINVKGLIISYLKDNVNYWEVDEIAEICSRILLLEFGTAVDNNSEILINNGKINKSQIIKEILKKYDKPLHIKIIFNEIEKAQPGIFKNVAYLRHVLITNSDFIHFGRTSTYGLKTWEENNNYLKGGTIRSIVEEYLARNKEPKDIFDIYQHVIKYRDTDIDNIYTNLRMDTSRTFTFFSGRFIGLAQKNYSSNKLKKKHINGSIFTKKYLTKYEGMTLENIIELYLESYKYGVNRLEYIFNKKLEKGEIYLKEGKIFVNKKGAFNE